MQTLKEYQDIVGHPGKFEGEAAYTPYFYDFMMEGDGDDVSSDCDGSIIRFEIDNDDIKLFPELAKVTHLELIFSDTGFVYGHPCII